MYKFLFVDTDSRFTVMVYNYFLKILVFLVLQDIILSVTRAVYYRLPGADGVLK